MNKNRAIYFLIVLNLMVVFFIIRLFQLQFVEYSKYEKLASDNAAKVIPILAPRGIVFDRHGKILLKNKPVFMVYILPHLLPKKSDVVFAHLANLISVPFDVVKQKYLQSKTPIFEGVLIASDIPLSVASRIEESRAKLPGVEVICYPLRSYPYKNACSHLLGYVREIESSELKEHANEGYRIGDLIGKDGIEKVYDKYIRGISGGKKIEVNAYGQPTRILGVLDPVPGNNVNLTIDIDLQLKVEEALGSNSGAVVVLNPNNGEVLAMASHPSYDLSRKWTQIDFRNHPFMNRALSSYPPGSTFKVVTLSAALEEGITSPSESFYCPGYYKLGKRIAKCWKASGHGRISPIEALVWSCDVVFYELGRRLGSDKIKKYADKYGLARYTGIDLPQEKRGFLPTVEWKKERFKENWYEGDSMNIGIGQGYIQVTPLQLACVYAQIATGIRYKPFVLKNIIDKTNKVIFENHPQIVMDNAILKSNSFLIKAALHDVVFRGTGVAAFVSKNEAAGKTGTAENPGRPHAWFVCYAPYTSAEVVITSFVEHGEHGDRVTARIAHDILEWYKKYRLINKTPEVKRPSQFIMHKDSKEFYGEKSTTSD